MNIVCCHIEEQYIIMVFYRRTFFQVSSSAGSVRGTQSQGSGGSRNPNRMSAAPILGTSAITSPSGGKIFLKKFSRFYYSYIMARSKISLLPCLPLYVSRMIYTLKVHKQLMIIFKPHDILIIYYLTIIQSILMAALQ